MADGAIIGRRAAIGQVAHTDGTATTVVTWSTSSLPEGYFAVRGEFTGGTASGTNSIRGTLTAQLRKSDAGLLLGVDSELSDYGATGYSAALVISGTDLVLQITAANGQRSVGHIELFGVELNLTIA